MEIKRKNKFTLLEYKISNFAFQFHLSLYINYKTNAQLILYISVFQSSNYFLLK